MSAPGIRDLRDLLLGIRPRRNPGVYVFARAPDSAALDLSSAVAAVREPEGTTIVLGRDEAEALGLEFTFPCVWITLDVPSSLEAVGLTAAVSRALADAGIPCNVVAGLHHDHLFVPEDHADRAMEVLRGHTGK